MITAATPPRHLLFKLGDVEYAVELDLVAEIIELPPLFPIPRAPSCYLGAMESHGCMKPVLELSAFCNIPRRKKGGRLIVLEERFANLALLVDEVSSVSPADTSEAETESAECGDGIFINGNSIPLLNLHHMLRKLEADIND